MQCAEFPDVYLLRSSFYVKAKLEASLQTFNSITQYNVSRRIIWRGPCPPSVARYGKSNYTYIYAFKHCVFALLMQIH
eukprot:3866232-Pleurochrysis_carterae.AAC.7